MSAHIMKGNADLVPSQHSSLIADAVDAAHPAAPPDVRSDLIEAATRETQPAKSAA